jgi:hypothetical protein
VSPGLALGVFAVSLATSVRARGGLRRAVVGTGLAASALSLAQVAIAATAVTVAHSDADRTASLFNALNLVDVLKIALLAELRGGRDHGLPAGHAVSPLAPPARHRARPDAGRRQCALVVPSPVLSAALAPRSSGCSSGPLPSACWCAEPTADAPRRVAPSPRDDVKNHDRPGAVASGRASPSRLRTGALLASLPRSAPPLATRATYLAVLAFIALAAKAVVAGTRLAGVDGLSSRQVLLQALLTLLPLPAAAAWAGTSSGSGDRTASGWRCFPPPPSPSATSRPSSRKH